MPRGPDELADGLDAAAVLNLQRLAGNRAVAQLISVQRAPCATYEPGERTKSRSSAGILGTDVSMTGGHGITTAGPDSVIVADFGVGRAAMKSSTVAELRGSWIGILEAQTKPTYEFVGYSDCVGEDPANVSLRVERAQAVAALFPKTAARSPVPRAGTITEFPVGNTAAAERAMNRSVIIRLPPTVKPPRRPRPAPETPHTKIPIQEPDTEGCGRAERDQLAIAWPAAKIMIGKALDWARTDKGGVATFLLKRYFGPDALTNIVGIRAGYEKILRDWVDWDNGFECHTQTEGSCPNKDPLFVTHAYVTSRGRGPFKKRYGKVHICAAAFGQIGNMQQLSATVVHELSHRLDKTTDHGYCQNPPECALSTKQALDNADSYAQFARDAFNSSM